MSKIELIDYTEICPNCGQEVNLRTYEAATEIRYCPYCGEEHVMLCSECMDRIGDCDRNNPKAYCKQKQN